MAEVVFVMFLHCKTTLSLPLSILYSLEGSCSTKATLKEKGVILHLVEHGVSTEVVWNPSA